MSLLNGIGALGSGLTAFADNGIKDQAAALTRAPLINSPPAASPESTAAASAAPAGAPSAAAGGSADVPAALLPIYQAASKRTGIPVGVLVAQAKQESSLDPNVVSTTGGIGLHQIQAATARDPGFGVAPVDPATLKDPAVNINFAADYLRARAGQSADFSDPAVVNAALKSFNGNGDPRYVDNVRRYMGAA